MDQRLKTVPYWTMNMPIKTSYAPTQLDDVIFSNERSHWIVNNLVLSPSEFPRDRALSVLLAGPQGTGKTTLAKLLPDAIEKAKFGEAAASNFTLNSCISGEYGLQALASIRRTVARVNIFSSSKRHYFVIDEVDNLSPATQQDLKSLLNNPNGVFVLTTNHLSVLDRGLIDRCTLVDMPALRPEKLLPLARTISDDIGLDCDDATLLSAIRQGAGSIRNLQANIRLCA